MGGSWSSATYLNQTLALTKETPVNIQQGDGRTFGTGAYVTAVVGGGGIRLSMAQVNNTFVLVPRCLAHDALVTFVIRLPTPSGGGAGGRAAPSYWSIPLDAPMGDVAVAVTQDATAATAFTLEVHKSFSRPLWAAVYLRCPNGAYLTARGASFHLVATVEREFSPLNYALWQVEVLGGARVALAPRVLPLYVPPSEHDAVTLAPAVLEAWNVEAGAVHGIPALDAERVVWERMPPTRIGKGGFAEVYRGTLKCKARGEEGGKEELRPLYPAAVKVFVHDTLTDVTLVEVMVRELRSIDKLRHPHILPIWGFHVGAGGVWMVMPRLARSADDAFGVSSVTARPLPLYHLLALAVAVLRVLVYIHGQRPALVHLDIKPSNILMDDRGCFFLADFGIARVVATSSSSGGFGTLGTPAYCAPENRGAEPGRGEPPSDIFSFGATLFALLHRRHPVGGDFRAGGEVALPASTPAPLADLVRACLRSSPAARPVAADLLRQLAPMVAADRKSVV